jgi:hypothetical protein
VLLSLRCFGSGPRVAARCSTSCVLFVGGVILFYFSWLVLRCGSAGYCRIFVSFGFLATVSTLLPVCFGGFVPVSREM